MRNHFAILGAVLAPFAAAFAEPWESIGENDATVRLDHHWSEWKRFTPDEK